ncbi:MAG: DnaJ domain-containing protein [Deltaproteobacteria bacterium]|nr:DnaJ domain-containing protein [Deltaproteobacteria bacterium]
MSHLSEEGARAAIRAWIDQQFQELGRSSYYHLLGVPRDATEIALRDAYYRLVARLHPDLFVDTLDKETRLKLVSIYSRVVEAYRVLSHGRRREQYDRLVTQGKLRWSTEEERSPPRDSESSVANPNAKRLFKLARSALVAGDAKSAVMNLKLALSVEPQNAFLREELAKAEALLKPQGG